MEYDCFYNPKLNAVESSTRGVADLTGMLEMLHRLAEVCRQHESANILVDHSQLDVRPLSMDHVRTLSLETVSLQDAFRMRKCALVVDTDLQFGLVRVWETLTELGGFGELDKKLFRSRQEADAWLLA